jgi:predicted phosphodiesterase
MKIGVFGDIHANLSALEAILAALDAEGCDQLICTGDVVGYGPSPAACIRLLRERDVPCVLGNHDKYVTLIADPQLDRLDALIRASIQWTQSVLEMRDLKWLAELPLRLDAEGFAVIHGMFGPHRWGYIVAGAKMRDEHFRHQDVPLAFCGHCHMPILGVQVGDDPPRVEFLRKATLPTADKVTINPGAVGQPRDLDPRAAAAIYDLDERTIRPIRAEYDIGATQALMREAKLPDKFIQRLADGK